LAFFENYCTGGGHAWFQSVNIELRFTFLLDLIGSEGGCIGFLFDVMRHCDRREM
jgi:hypothetical protein